MCDDLMIRLSNNVLRTIINARKMALASLTEIDRRGKSHAVNELGVIVSARNGERAAAAIIASLYALTLLLPASLSTH